MPVDPVTLFVVAPVAIWAWRKFHKPPISNRMQPRDGWFSEFGIGPLRHMGKEVWYSYDKHNPRFQHAVMLVDGWKYELRLNEDQVYINVVRTDLRPTDSNYTFKRAGWTDKTHTEIEALARKLGRTWRYNQITRNCHKFLNRLFSKIISEENKSWNRENFRNMMMALPRR